MILSASKSFTARLRAKPNPASKALWEHKAKTLNCYCLADMSIIDYEVASTCGIIDYEVASTCGIIDYEVASTCGIITCYVS